MNIVYPTVGSGLLKTNTNEAFEMAQDGPVVVLSRTVPKAVMVGVEAWNAIAEELARLRVFHNREMDRRSAEIDAGNFMTQEQVEDALGL